MKKSILLYGCYENSIAFFGRQGMVSSLQRIQYHIRFLWCRDIPAKHIIAIGKKTPIAKDIRLFAVGGLFGYIGTFRGNDCGQYKAYVNNGSNAFYVKTEDGKCYVASCNNAEELIELVKQRIHLKNKRVYHKFCKWVGTPCKHL